MVRTRGHGHAAAVRFGDWLDGRSTRMGLSATGRGPLLSTEFALLEVDDAVEQQAWKIFARHDRSGFSYADCTSFAAMQLLGLGAAFAFDSHFAEMGFQMVPGESS
jgi:hypothetical protein